MIIVRTPLRLPLAGEGTDSPEFLRGHPGAVISVTINKYVYLAIKPTDLLGKFIMKYQTVETVDHPRELVHDRFRTALLKLGITDGGLEIASFADIPAKTGLGSSASFSVALLKGLYAHLGRPLSKTAVAEAAFELELELPQRPEGKHDHYAAALGGFNMFHFHPGGAVESSPILIDFRTRALLRDHLLLFFVGGPGEGSAHPAAGSGFEKLRERASRARVFQEKLAAGDMAGLGGLLREEWPEAPATQAIAALYGAAQAAGAWSAKVLGPEGSCLLFMAPPERHADVRAALTAAAARLGLENFQEIPFSFSQSGVDVLFNSGHLA